MSKKKAVAKQISLDNENTDLAYSAQLATEEAAEPAPRMDARLSIAEKLAGTSMHVKNWVYDGAREDFPNEPWMRHVAYFFPKTKHGPLYMDRPINDYKTKECERRARALAARGLKYFVIKSKITFDKIEQEFLKCLGQQA